MTLDEAKTSGLPFKRSTWHDWMYSHAGELFWLRTKKPVKHLEEETIFATDFYLKDRRHTITRLGFRHVWHVIFRDRMENEMKRFEHFLFGGKT